MALRLSQVQAGTKALDMPVEGEVLRLVYRVGQLTPATLDRVEQIESIDDIVALLLEWLVEWDMEDDNGEWLPVNEATLRALPLPFLRQMFRFVLSDGRTDPLPSRSSAGGSFQAGQ